ncbi:MAG: hypothetical protein ACO1OO_08605 [Flavisolibacter sp.]
MAKLTKPSTTKSLFAIKDTNRRKLKIASAITDRDMQDIVNEALENWFERYEKKHGPLPVK